MRGVLAKTRKIDFLIGVMVAGVFAAGSACGAQTANQAWLSYRRGSLPPKFPTTVVALGRGELEQTAALELVRGLQSIDGAGRKSEKLVGHAIVIGTFDEFRKRFPDWKPYGEVAPRSLVIHDHLRENLPLSEQIPLEALGKVSPIFERFSIHLDLGEARGSVFIEAPKEKGDLYGVFALLRLLASGEDVPTTGIVDKPAMGIRWVDEWDNANGSVERGYAGKSIFFEDGHVREDLTAVGEYARLLASVGIDGCNVNNVNGAAPFLSPQWLAGMKRIADAMRPWGVRLSMSVDIASPQKIGGLSTFDPLDPRVQSWWAAKVGEIYTLIPDFAGFTVKADSEGQAGPASYGRSPADAANLLANALKPHGGIVLYRAFVYNNHLDYNDLKADRARAAYDIFHPLDGMFAPNVIVQTKEGPIDFQAREPVSPLFGGLEKTSQAMELQITQEYLGQQRHLVYIAPMWKQVLDFDLHAENRSTPVKEIVEGKSFHRPLGGMVGVASVGRDGWLGSPLAMANLYAFGRLAWNPDLTPQEIAREWARQTFGTDDEVLAVVEKMLMQSWPAYEHYTGPLGAQTLTDITGSHYGPNIEASERNGWGQWHRDDAQGIGIDRSVATGTGFAGQYPPEIAREYESPATTPDELLLFFHHVPYTYQLHSGKTVIQYIYDSHYEGAEQAAQLGQEWAMLKGKVDDRLFGDVQARLEYQAGHAIVWRDAIVQYFLKQSGIPDAEGRAGHYPGRLEAEDAKLTGYKVIDVTPWEDASGGRAVACDDAKSCSAEWKWTGADGRFDIAVEYFDLQGGAAKFTLDVNGAPAASWSADANLPSRRPNGDNSTRYTVRNVRLKAGDLLRMEGVADGSDPAALDYVEVMPAANN
jgi:alpha-glucuronidase